ncbi:MAG: hypothetical protein RQ833_10420 [Sphingomonadaceae bacterium]|nr:hypothetical protein [Sphingomonadaceae bacterium]
MCGDGARRSSGGVEGGIIDCRIVGANRQRAPVAQPQTAARLFGGAAALAAGRRLRRSA